MLSSWLGSFAWVFALFLAQNALFYLFPDRAPCLVLAGVLYYSLFEGALSGMVVGCWGGLLIDLFSQGRPGFFVWAFASSGLFCGFASSKIFEDSWLSEVVLPFVSLYAVLFAQQCALRSQMGEAVFPGALADAFLPWPLLTTSFFSPFIFNYLRKFSPRQRRRWAPRY